jgi:hypothetical protein
MAELDTALPLGEHLEAPEALLFIASARPIRSEIPLLAPLIVFAKRVVRRLLAWYIQPIASDQTEFNLAVLRELRALQAKLEGRHTDPAPGERPQFAPRLLLARASAIAEVLEGSSTVLAIAADRPLVEALADLDVRVETLPPPSGEDWPANLIAQLEREAGRDAAALLLPGVVAGMTAAQVQSLMKAGASVLHQGGILAIDSPDPSYIALDDLETGPALRMTATLGREAYMALAEASGLVTRHIVTVAADDSLPWFVATFQRLLS